MLDDIVSISQKRHRDLEEKIKRVHEVLAEFGPLTKEDLFKKCGMPDWDFQQLFNYLTPTAGLNKIPLNIRSSEFLGLLKSKTVVYAASQVIELGMYIGYNICCSLTYPYFCGKKRSQITSCLSHQLPNRAFVVVRLHYPGMLRHFINDDGTFAKPTDAPDNEWAILSSANFAKFNRLTEEGKRVIEGVRKNMNSGYDEFLNYWRGLRKKC